MKIKKKKPEWLKKKIDFKAHEDMGRMLKGLDLNTICREASCPNISECFSCGRATFLILGTACTRACTFCNVSNDIPQQPNDDEPSNVAKAVHKLGLEHVVITSPTRDDLPDYGAGHFAKTIAAIRKLSPDVRIEILVPDFRGDEGALRIIAEAKPDIFGHNIETVESLYDIRKGADYQLSLDLLKKRAAEMGMLTKSGIMLGLGELCDETMEVMEDIRNAGVSYLSIGQYLPPSKNHQPVAEYITPSKFEKMKGFALGLGFKHVESGPYVRSSYMAEGYK